MQRHASGARPGAKTGLASLDLTTHIRPGDRVTWGQGSAEPQSLVKLLVAQLGQVGGLHCFVGVGASEVLDGVPRTEATVTSYAGGGSNGHLAAAGLLEILPVHYSELPDVLSRGRHAVDVLLLQVAPADDTGTYSWSLAQEYLDPLLETARVVIAEVNDQAPWTHASRTLRREDFDVLVSTSVPPLPMRAAQPSYDEQAVAGRVVDLIKDGTTLQVGLGTVPTAVLKQLGGHRDLGVHSGVITDDVADLMQRGIVTNTRKTRDFGRTVTGLLMGTDRLFDFAARNPCVQLRPTSYTHDPVVLASLDRFVAVNSALEVDLTGQVNAEWVAGRYRGAVGGAVDFLRGASRSRDGLPIVALPSTAGHHSRITPTLSGPVTIARSDVGVVVTEFGAVDLRGLTLAERRQHLLDLAHPDHRAELAAAPHADAGKHESPTRGVP